MSSRLFATILCSFLISQSSCILPTGYIDKIDIIYFNSFESPQDTIGWTGYGSMQLSGDIPPGGGKTSISVSGGCIIPHAAFTFGPFQKDIEVVIEGWGKALLGSGGVGLATDFQDAAVYRGIGFSVRDSEWTFYRSEEVLFVEKDKKLTIHIGAGGIAPGTILVDLLTIRKVDE